MKKLLDDGNYVVVVALLCGAFGTAYGIFQGTSAEALGQYPMPPAYLVLLAGAVWGLIGLLIGAVAMTILNLGYWAVPLCLFLALLFSQFDTIPR